MSVMRGFKISVHKAIFGSFFVLLGVLIGSVFIRISSLSLVEQFADRYLTFYTSPDLTGILSIFLKELVMLALMTAFSYLPYGQIAALVLLFYKGFCIGIVSAISCWQFSLVGIQYILLLILPQNLIYLAALLLAAQITFYQVSGLSADVSKHTKVMPAYKSAYPICYILLIVGVLFESLVQPWLYRTFF